jgi:hypothetical protein
MIRYRDLTVEQRAIICNGCGPKGRWIPIPDFCFHASCDHHDFNYWIGCTWRDRLKADNQFYREMRRDAGWDLKYQLWALIYYIFVRLFGAAGFHFADVERDRADLAAIMDCYVLISKPK